VSGWRATLAVLLVFVAGGVSGGAAVYLLRLRAEQRIVNSPEPVIQLVIAALDRDLGLSQEQKGEIREVLLRGRGEILTAHPELMPELIELFERTQNRIGETLTPEQRLKYQHLVDQRRRLLEEVRRSAEQPRD
jgi:uncharacterized membrane protein